MAWSLRAVSTKTLEITTNPGLEALVIEELSGLVPLVSHETRPHGFQGRVRVSGDATIAVSAKLLRSAHHVLEERCVVTFDAARADVADVAERLARAHLPELKETSHFCVRVNRVGDHRFQSPDLEAKLGGSLVRAYGTRVRLKKPQTRVRVDVRDDKATLALQLTEDPLSHRYYPRPYQQRTALKANVAFAALHALRAFLPCPPRRLLDLFAGSGTILLEAATLFPEAELFGVDKKPLAANGCRDNLAAFGMAERASVWCSLATRVCEFLEPNSIDAVVTNPPYGVRLGRGLDFSAVYGELFGVLRHVLRPNGVGVVLVVREPEFQRAAVAAGFKVELVSRVQTRSVTPAIFVAVPPAS